MGGRGGGLRRDSSVGRRWRAPRAVTRTFAARVPAAGAQPMLPGAAGAGAALAGCALAAALASARGTMV